jgi:hypothetical protein
MRLAVAVGERDPWPCAAPPDSGSLFDFAAPELLKRSQTGPPRRGWNAGSMKEAIQNVVDRAR